MLWAWIMFGAVVGLLAAVKRGMSPATGVIAGGLLGLFSPLLFFVSGISKPGDLKSKKCPYCAETVKPEAVLCRHCGKSLALPGTPPS